MYPINYRRGNQDRLARELAAFKHPAWEPEAYGDLVYGTDNIFLTSRDVFTLSAMIQRLRPQKIVEIGSGWSTLSMLDVMRFAGLDLHIHSFDVDGHRLTNKLPPNQPVTFYGEDIRTSGVLIQHVLTMHANDILFIDGNHNGAADGTAAYAINEILPMLPDGAVVCWHDIWPDWKTPTPKEDGGEQAILRAFLSYNEVFQILFFLPQYVEANPSFMSYAPHAGEYAGSLMFVVKCTP